ncbi:hypothetical protein SCUCBS95973_000124 [Sporothrix curviconia]|uniref:Nima interactive protein n=1 Tax=Sporothrix curviconia TaxID=1260050 RepID=A0ABP0AL48_9PEZI
MTDLANLQTASLYINNQLLSRGLLRDGRAIDFANPTGGKNEAVDKDSNADGSKDSNSHTADTMARIISVVNDLILRRDRDAEHRESLSTALRTVRAESLRQANDLQRAIERHAEAQRRADLGDAAEASLRAQLAAAETANRKLREEAARMRQQVAQTRASCANEVRKRDRQIDGLKKAVSDAGRARGERRNPAITTISITGADASHQQQHRHTPRPGVASSLQSTPNVHSSATKGNTTNMTGVTTDSEYDLRNETNAFLADLARGLSEDNELLVDLVRHTSQQLKTMSGYMGDEQQAADNRVSSLGAVDCGAMVVEMEAVLEHLRTILTNPSFVPIEEVVERESEIGRLRDGWEKMEGRWKEAVHLLDGWRRRMAVSGRPVNMEEIKMGLRLSPVRVRNVAETTMGLDLRLPPPHEGLADDDMEENFHGDEDGNGDEDEDDSDAHNWPPLGRTPSPAETLHLVPAPAPEAHDHEPGHAGLSDSESDTSSMFSDDVDDDDDEPNVQIIEQSLMIPSFETSTAPAVFARSTPSPPPPEKPAMSRITAAVIQETRKETGTTVEQPKAAATKPSQHSHNALRPSHTAGNRGGIGAAAAGAKTASSSDVKKETANVKKEVTKTAAAAPTAVARGRRRPEEIAEEPPKERKQVRIVAAATASEKPPARPAAPRVVASTTATAGSAAATGLRRANSARAAGGRPAPASRTAKPAPARPISVLAQEREKQRPASAASQASEASAASSSTASEDSVAPVPSTSTATTSARPVSSPASRKPVTATSSSSSAPTTARSRLDQANRPANDDKATAAASASSSSSEQMPPPPAPMSTAAAANRARSRSRIKMSAAAAGTSGSAAMTATTTATAGGVSSRLPLPTSSNIPPPPSPALNMATIAAKLAASEREADAARVRAKLKAARSGLLGAAKAKMAPVEAPVPAAAAEADSNVDPVKKALDDEADPLATSVTSTGAEPPQQQQPLRKKRDAKDQRRVSKAASRRRSTLNPSELKSLMSGSVEGAAPTAEPAIVAP